MNTRRHRHGRFSVDESRRFAATGCLLVIAYLPRPSSAALADSAPIRANATTISITVAPSEYAGKIAVYELSPNDPDDAWRGKQPVATGGIAAKRVGRLSFDRFENVAIAGTPPGMPAAPVPGPRDGPGLMPGPAPAPKAGRRSPPGPLERGLVGRRDRLYSKFVVAPADGNREPLLPARFIDDMTGFSKRRVPFPKARSKKGLQVQMVDDALALGISHAALNVNLAGLFAWQPDPNAIPYMVDGQVFLFNGQVVAGLDQQVIPLSHAGVTVSLILLNYTTTNDPNAERFMRHPNYDSGCPNKLSAFNTVTDDGIRHYKAAVEFLIDRYTQPDGRFGRALNYIIGNEVNSHWHWCNMGQVSLEDFTEAYLRAMRIAATAAEKICPTARIYMSLEHHWNIRFDSETKSFPGRAFVELFAERARDQGDFPWHVAYHPYPDNLMEPATWKDKNATSDVNTSPKITFKNIELLPEYFHRPALLYRGQPRHIILSEQGFHTKDGPDGEALQAAGYCYAWYKIKDLVGVDSFILHRHVDNRDEAGLKLGLWTRVEAGDQPAAPGRPKRIYEVFRMADTPGWERAFEFAKPIIGIKEWDTILPSPGRKAPAGARDK